MAETKLEEDMSPEERLQWLRDRGVLVETPEERRAKEVAKILNEADELKETISFVLVPFDSSKPLKEFSFESPVTASGGDKLMDHLKPFLAGMSGGKEVDLSLFREHAAKTLGSSDVPSEVSEDTLRAVASQGNVEKFPLVHPTDANQFVGVNIYLDEVGMLKRLPLNPRATDFAAKAGYNPPPQFYGNVFIGRIKARPVVQNMSFHLGKDTSPGAEWLRKATMDNLEHQTAMNNITGRSETQAAVDGTDGAEKVEDGYSWTQTEEEIELVVSLPPNAQAKDIRVKYLPQALKVQVLKESLLSLNLFERVDPDGCTWTMDRSTAGEVSLIVTMEKVEEALWPRLKD